ncbi:MAG: T9SS type B sorting domain-containing protein, partial [Chitinophagaceae bacterium]
FKPRDPVIYPRIEGVRGTSLQLSALSGGVQYNWLPITGLDNAGIQNPIANYNVTHPNIINYTINITDSLGCKVKDKQEVWLFADADIFVPTAFTPNGDGANDILKPLYVNIAKVNYFRIFDRWGKVIFETSDMGKAWDGTMGGNNMPMETYSWVMDAVTQQGKQIVRKGNTTLIRN